MCDYDITFISVPHKGIHYIILYYKHV